ncbi:mannose-1-phosphate guanylyltransferase [Algimonas arctica]|uniref:Mannose-1-phosphate guanylyltransferase n=1 Tax=Algimonas arctica TaxID=1479486 RepID=A0A8J3G3C7_9PROT|nr:nucleotidyltransferase family protein [Algimonas arctica]GHB02563.1 mannose-1-phosphate guanylyltransferase [Algimonas arctica]
MIETAMVMAAGHGTRMRPLTDDRSKAMVVVAGRPLIDHMLDRLDDAGVKRAIVNVHAHPDHLEAHLKARTRGPKIKISCERAALLETGGGVVKALPLLGDAPILICNIDAVWTEFSPVIQALFQAWDEEEMDDLFLLAPTQDCLGFDGPGDFDMNRLGQLDWRTGATAPWVYAGVQIFTPARAKGYPQTRFSRTEIWRKTIARRRVFGLPIPGYWMHVGDPRAVKAAEAVVAQDTGVSA